MTITAEEVMSKISSIEKQEPRKEYNADNQGVHTVYIRKKEVKIFELTGNQLVAFLETSDEKEEEEGKEEKQQTLLDIIDAVKKVYPIAVSGWPVDDFMELRPSEMKIIWEAFQKVNSVFFSISKAAKLTETVIGLAQKVIVAWGEQFAVILPALIAQGIQTQEAMVTPSLK